MAHNLLHMRIKVLKLLEPDLPSVLATYTGLEEVIINLMVNAMEALNSIQIGPKQILVKTYLEKFDVVMEISDNGPGVDDDIKSRVFDPFFTTKTKESNMGLGLSIVNSIITSYNGHVMVLDNDSGGTKFCIRLPVCNSLREEACL